MSGEVKHPDVIAWETFLANNPDITSWRTLGTSEVYLRNRLRRAFEAGIKVGRGER